MDSAKTVDAKKTQGFGKDLAKLALGAIGVVYGDIGTSPLYAVKECFTGEHGVAPTTANVLGVISLVFWSLTLVIVVKYLSFVISADHDGEGGILALLALATKKQLAANPTRSYVVLVMVGLFGSALLYGDGIITPAISVLSAVEGLEVATPVFQPFIVPITVVILIGLFLVQKRGTGGIGLVFGPMMVIWFVSIAAVALPWIIREPRIFHALNPLHAFGFLFSHGLHGLLVLGAVVLCITGGEALYADLGHFGARPIRFAWYVIVFPALLLNYFGQGALLLSRGVEATANPFYALVPSTLLYPMVVIATLATVIASQALISGAFSLTQQAVQLGYLPRVRIVHTSGQKEGQIYIPEVRSILMVACVLLVLSFRTSSNLAAAYGIAVTGTMTITSILFYTAMRERWGKVPTALLTGAFLIFDLAFFAGNAGKIPHGGWFSLAVAAMIFAVMTTWRTGRMLLRQSVMAATLPLEMFLDDVAHVHPTRVPGTAVFMTLNPNVAPAALLHNFKHNKVVHEQVVLLTVTTERVPEVPASKRLTIKDWGQGFFQVIAHYGFMQRPDVMMLMERAASAGVKTGDDTSYYLSRETLRATGRSGMSAWRTALFAFLSRNAYSATDYFGIPANRVVELGMQVEL
ncbi:MAG: potassium transporter Kup [Deltaproteobacteria bacterium]|nr:potassium transporter Kup [Deltaproteobacteria bacterium]